MSLRQSAVVFTAMHRPLINLIVLNEGREKDSLIVSFYFQINYTTKCNINFSVYRV